MICKALCNLCGAVTEIELDDEGRLRYESGMVVQKAFPKLSPMERELIITGTCFSCQEGLFNRPAPGNEEKFGKFIKECECCGCTLWEKDMKEGKLICPSCMEEN